MRLLVSVCDAAEAIDAVAGGADIVDAKEPSRGALGAVSIDVMRRIRSACGGIPITAALGERLAPTEAEAAAESFVRAGAGLVKIGFADAVSDGDVIETLEAAVRGAHAGDKSAGVIAVAFVDAPSDSPATPATVLRAAGRARASGVLLDTIQKSGPGLRRLVSLEDVSRWAAQAHRAGLSAAVAGRLSADDINGLAPTGVDIVGVRGAACAAGRTTRIDAAKVTTLRMRCSMPASL